MSITNTNSDPNSNSNSNSNSYPYSDADSASFGKHNRHCHLLHKSDSASSARCDDDPDWHFVGLNADRWLG